MVSLYAMCVMVMECTAQYREMCYYICICSVCNGDAVYGQYREMCYSISICNVCN